MGEVERGGSKTAGEIEIKDNTEQVKSELKNALLRALERCGSEAEGIAKDLCPVDTGRLRESITHAVDPKEKAAYIGTNVEYAAYVELGTGKYYEGGRSSGWSYNDNKGHSHFTVGQRAQPYLKPAATEHVGDYRRIFRSELGENT